MGRPLALLFDFDGTIADTVDLIVGSAEHAFAGYSRAMPARDEWLGQLGRPLADCFRPFVADEADIALLIARYREFQREHHDRLTRAYDGVNATLDALRAAGHRMGIVTSKSDALVARGLQIIGLAHHMDAVVGLESCTRHKPDPEPVRIALEKLGAAPADAAFIGDSTYDMLAGNAAGVITIAALWGPYSRTQLAAAEPDYYLDRIEELPALIREIEAPDQQ